MKKYKNLIINLPIKEHAFTTKRSTWEKYTKEKTHTSEIIDEFFEKKETIELSRNDLFALSEKRQYKKLIIATILWGYPRGMRGNNFENILQKISILESILTSSKLKIVDFENHYKLIEPIKGLGLSTYSKLLYFCNAKINSTPCVILDKKIIETIQKGFIPELISLKNINYNNAATKYLSYIQAIDKIAKKIRAPNENIEMFLFQFGKNLKPLSSLQKGRNDDRFESKASLPPSEILRKSLSECVRLEP